MKRSDRLFAQKIARQSGTSLAGCFSCATCTSGCPFAHIMDYKPHQMIRLVQIGMRETALQASAPWFCVGCNTCSGNCPNAIDIPAVMDALREVAIVEGRTIPEPNVLSFHNAVLNSVKRYGRTHKLEIMMRYKMDQRDMFSDIDVGLKMFSKRKLDVMPSRISGFREVKNIFKKAG